MKKLVLFFMIVGFLACKKDKEVFKTSSSINVINVVLDVGAIQVNPTGGAYDYSKTTDQVAYGSSRFYYAELGQRSIVAVLTGEPYPVVFNGSYDMQPGFYTMYLSGPPPRIDTMFRKEIDFPFIKTDITIPPESDNVVNVRFVNLCSNSPALKINIKGSTINEVEDFNYKQIGNWKTYKNNGTTTTNYIFEIRNSATNVLLLSYTFGATATNRYKNVALVIKGLAGTTTGASAFGVFPVNYF